MKISLPHHRRDIDILKGLAIIAVVLYHAGISHNGYLGVDVFFVINGFLIVPKVVNDICAGRFAYIPFLEKRIVRLLPLLLLISLIVLLVGCVIGMLPDDYENLSQSVIATNILSNNILQAITTKNYWDAVNEYKPLMHTWYVGILFEFYIILPIFTSILKYVANKIKKDCKDVINIGFIALTIISFILYLMPSVSIGDRFYLPQYRFFELAIGGLIGINIKNIMSYKITKNGILSSALFVILLIIVIFNINPTITNSTDYNIVTGALQPGNDLIPQQVLLIATVIITSILLASNNQNSTLINQLERIKPIGWFGQISYSIFIWHQPLLAFYRYYISETITLPAFILFIAITTLLSIATYYTIEKKISINKATRFIIICAFVLINGAAYAIYANAGVVRDVPELDVKKGNVHKGMFAEYNDRVYSYNKDFDESNDNINVLIIGNSFARDWGNILLESPVSDKINVSYIFAIDKKYESRISKSDYIFIFDMKSNIPDYFWSNVSKYTKIWGIGTKNFGTSNGIIYKNRKKDNYTSQTIKIISNFEKINDIMKEEWGEDKYIDLYSIVKEADGRVRVFSDDGKFLSQDCRHLTKGGAQFYAKHIDFNAIFNLN